MPRPTRFLPVRVLKIWFDVVLVFGSIAAVIFLVWLALAPFVVLKSDMAPEATVRVAIGQRSWIPVLPLTLNPTPVDQEAAIESAALVNVLADQPFAAANGKLLRRCGYIILIIAAAYPFFDFALADYALSRIDVTNIDLRPAITFDKHAFVVGLLFLVFGLILDRGHQLQKHEQELQQDQALTI